MERVTNPAVALGAYLEAVDAFAPGLVEGVYLVGSYALGDWQAAHSDLDVVAVTAEPASDDDARQLRAAHAMLGESQPEPHIDGPYVAWGDLSTEASTGLHRPWVLAGDFHHDGDCFEINPVTWYTLARYGVAVRGPATEDLAIATDTNERIRFVIENLRTYWAELTARVRAAAEAGEHERMSAALLEWCVLGPLRLHYTAATGDVTSKRGAGEHGLTVAPRHALVIEAALAARTGALDDPLDPDVLPATAALMEWVLADTGTSA